MLDTDTKRRIDTARDILVGKVPDPKSQVEQITIALIYKFMDDMDRQSEELGGKASFFTGTFKKYRWSQLLDKRIGGHVLNLLSSVVMSMKTGSGPMLRKFASPSSRSFMGCSVPDRGQPWWSLRKPTWSRSVVIASAYRLSTHYGDHKNGGSLKSRTPL